jgi:CDP-diacylglycerol--glycerol-3-phosphate 3-phosphatidyltransferase
MVTIYNLKPKFQNLLRPLVKKLYRVGITANFVTIFACAASIAVTVIIWLFQPNKAIFFIVPIFMFVRMALNAIDGMLAREFNQKTTLGAYLNELCDIVSDAALYLVFIFAAFPPLVIAAVILSLISEYAGVMAPLVGGSRRYDGPMGKSDRAFVFSVIGVMAGADILTGAIDYLLWAMLALLCLTIFNRVKGGLANG